MRYVLLSSSAVRLLAAFDMYQNTTAEMTDMVFAYGRQIAMVELLHYCMRNVFQTDILHIILRSRSLRDD